MIKLTVDVENLPLLCDEIEVGKTLIVSSQLGTVYQVASFASSWDGNQIDIFLEKAE